MKALALIIGLVCSGCFSTWAIGQAGGKSFSLEEQVREETVPLPASEERLTISMPLTGDVALQCTSVQAARESVYRSSVRYGGKWKKATAQAFAAEAALASGFLLLGDRNKVETYAYGGFFALDALGTAALFFAPRKELFKRTERDVNTPVREDCPAGLVLEIAGNAFPVDAAGRIGEAGDIALEDWMKSRNGALLVSLAGRTTELRIPVTISTGTATTMLAVPLGTLTAIGSDTTTTTSLDSFDRKQ